jgi:hypothetical protein
MPTEKYREEILNEILHREWAMFHTVPNAGGSASCQNQAQAFSLMRQVAYYPLSTDFLLAWRDALRKAAADGRNLMTEKYMLMEKKKLPLSPQQQHIEQILANECAWYADFSKEFPRTAQPDNGAFYHYLCCELHTYPKEALQAYAACVQAAQKAGKNLVRERYEFLAYRLGYTSLAAWEGSAHHD